MTPFTDDDLKRLKESLLDTPYVKFEVDPLLVLLARMEAAEKAIFWENAWDRDRQIEAWRKAAGR